jgi:hypothetical protein
MKLDQMMQASCGSKKLRWLNIVVNSNIAKDFLAHSFIAGLYRKK